MLISAIPFNAYGVVSASDSDHELNAPYENLDSVTLDQYAYSCIVCNYDNIKYTPSANQDFVDGEIVKRSKCEVDVWRHECDSCGAVYFQALSTVGHTPVASKGRPASCTEAGYTEGEICLDCDAIIVYPKVIPATGAHTWNAGVVTKKATCAAAGVKTYTCTVCGDKKTSAIAATGTHKWNSGVVTKKATCTATGVKTYTCTVCGEKKTSAIAKIAHSYKTTTTKATASKNGKIVKKCACGKVASTTTIYKIKSVKLSKTTYTYSGSAKKPKVTVKDSKGKTVSSKYYTVKYSKNKNIGKATVKVTFKGNYSGTKSLTFKINPQKVKSLKLKSSKKKQLTVSWKKDSKVTGYEIVYATNSKFTKGKKTVKVTSYKTVKKTIKSLKSKKTYYVKVRSYKTVSGKKYYSAYTSVKKLKIK